MNFQVIRAGFTAATRYPAPLIMLFILTLVIALVLTVPVYTAMDGWMGHRLIARDLARDFDGWLVLEPLMSNARAAQAGEAATGAQPVSTLVLAMVVTTSLAWLLSSLPNAVLGGGALLIYIEGRFTWRRLAWGAWHWLFPFVLLAILFALCALVVMAVGAGIVMVLGAVRATELTTPAWVLVAWLYAIVTMVFEYARVIAVAEGRRNILRSLGRAVVFIVRQPLQSFGLYLLLSALGLALIPLYSSVIAPLIPFEWGIVAVAAQQLFIVARMWVRLARWAGEAALYRQGTLAQTAISGDNYSTF